MIKGSSLVKQTERYLKSVLKKKKISITESVVIAFMIVGTFLGIGRNTQAYWLVTSDGKIGDEKGLANHPKSISINPNKFGGDNVGTGAIAIGYDATAPDMNSVAMGHGANSFKASVAIGAGANGSENNSVAIGKEATASSNGAIAIGYQAKASGDNSVAIGNGSKASGSSGEGYYAGSKKEGNISTPNMGEFAIGDGANSTRRLTGLAAGKDDTDAVNVSQLKSLAENEIKLVGDNNSSTSVKTLGNTDGSKNTINFGIKGETNSPITTTASGNDITIKLAMDTTPTKE